MSKSAFAMAGIFGVPEGFKIGQEDELPALVPLFSPDLDLTVFGTLFGNVEKKHGAGACAAKK